MLASLALVSFIPPALFLLFIVSFIVDVTAGTPAIAQVLAYSVPVIAYVFWVAAALFALSIIATTPPIPWADRSRRGRYSRRTARLTALALVAVSLFESPLFGVPMSSWSLPFEIAVIAVLIVSLVFTPIWMGEFSHIAIRARKFVAWRWASTFGPIVAIVIIGFSWSSHWFFALLAMFVIGPFAVIPWMTCAFRCSWFLARRRRVRRGGSLVSG